VTGTVVMGGYRALPECLTTITRRANSAKVLRSRTPAKLYVYDTLLQRLARDLQHMTPELGKLIQTEYAVMCQRYVPRHLAPCDQL
jgi:hypothetical protein